MIPYAQHHIDDDDIAAVTAAMKSGFLTTGPCVEEFEAGLRRVTGARYAVAVANGTAALHLAAMAMGIGPGDEVILSPLTFAASANCVLYCGGTPVFADVDPDTMLLDPEEVKRKITSRTKAVIPVHYGGECCEMKALTDLADTHGLQLLQDAAHALGSLANGRKLGEYPGQQIWSFHPAKTITTGEGGAITSNDEAVYRHLLRLRTHGITRDPTQWTGTERGGWYYEQLDLGYNYRIADLQCALGVSQLRKLDRFARRRGEIVARYDEAFQGLPLRTQASPSWSQAVRHLYPIRVSGPHLRRRVYDFLHEKGIGVNVHYLPVYWLPYYERLGYPKGLCPHAEDAYQGLITLPLYPAMTDDQIDFVIRCVQEAAQACR